MQTIKMPRISIHATQYTKYYEKGNEDRTIQEKAIPMPIYGRKLYLVVYL
jgi:hypothetical protein